MPHCADCRQNHPPNACCLVAPPERWAVFDGQQVEFPDWWRAVSTLEQTMRYELRQRSQNMNQHDVDALVVRMWCTQLQAILLQHPPGGAFDPAWRDRLP